MAPRSVSRSITVLGILALVGAGLGALAAPTSAAPAPAPPTWPANNSEVPAGVFGIQIVLSGGTGGGSSAACQITSSHRVMPGSSVSWILGADGVDGTVSSGGVETGGAGGLGAYGYSGAAGGNSSTINGAKSGGGGSGASAFEVNGQTRIVAGGTGGSAAGYMGGWGAGWCNLDGSSGSLVGDMGGGGVSLASSMTDVVVGGIGGTASHPSRLPGANGNPSTGVGAGEGGVGGGDSADSPYTLGGGGGGGGGFAGGGGGVGSTPGSQAAPGGGGGNMVAPSPFMAAPKFGGGPSQQAVINWVHISGATLTAARAGVSYTATPTATFGSATTTTPLAADSNAAWSVDSTGAQLPDGLQLNTTTGAITGKATTPGSYSFILIAALDGDGGMVAFSKATYHLRVLPNAPDAPRSVTATAGNASATVNWIKPASNGGSAISKYVVRQSPGGAVCTITTPAPLTCDISGLVNGISYTFTVVAINAGGTSDASDPSPAVEPQATRQRQIVHGVPLPSELTRTGGNVLLKRSTFTSSGQPVRVQVSVTPLLRARPAGDLELYRMVTGANGSKTLYITTSQPVSVTVKLYAAASRGYLKWTKARAYSL